MPPWAISDYQRRGRTTKATETTAAEPILKYYSLPIYRKFMSVVILITTFTKQEGIYESRWSREMPKRAYNYYQTRSGHQGGVASSRWISVRGRSSNRS